MEAYFRVDVRDDYDGGSVWIVHEDFITTYREAHSTALELSLTRENKIAKVIQIQAEDIIYCEDGSQRSA